MVQCMHSYCHVFVIQYIYLHIYIYTYLGTQRVLHSGHKENQTPMHVAMYLQSDIFILFRVNLRMGWLALCEQLLGGLKSYTQGGLGNVMRIESSRLLIMAGMYSFILPLIHIYLCNRLACTLREQLIGVGSPTLRVHWKVNIMSWECMEKVVEL